MDALAAYCEEKVIEDVAVASTDVELINYAYEQNYLIRGIVLFEEADYSEEGLLAIREKVNANHAKVAILPYEGISKEVVEYLQKLLVTVWVNGPEAESDTTFMTQILSGANGIVVSDRAAAEKCFTEYFEENRLPARFSSSDTEVCRPKRPRTPSRAASWLMRPARTLWKTTCTSPRTAWSSSCTTARSTARPTAPAISSR